MGKGGRKGELDAAYNHFQSQTNAPATNVTYQGRTFALTNHPPVQL